MTKLAMVLILGLTVTGSAQAAKKTICDVGPSSKISIEITGNEKSAKVFQHTIAGATFKWRHKRLAKLTCSEITETPAHTPQTDEISAFLKCNESDDGTGYVVTLSSGGVANIKTATVKVKGPDGLKVVAEGLFCR